MIKEIDLVIHPDDIFDTGKIQSTILHQEKIDKQQLHHFVIRKRSIDARGRQVFYRLKVI